MSKKQYPSKQEFNVSAKKNLNKRNAWWQKGSSNNPRKKDSE